MKPNDETNENSMFKNLNWQEVDQLAFFFT